VAVIGEPLAYSYRADGAVPKFDDSRPLLIFDGLCVLCSGGVQFMLRHDRNKTCRFTVVQDPVPQALYLHYGLDATRFTTFMVLADGVPHTKWQGLLAAAKLMGGIWKPLGVIGGFVPSFLGNWIYDVVQNNRLQWFGSRATCFLPSEIERRRFL
jgi:predicted DCC family thiol-disulfide oxidoreductase YuxK